MSSSHTHAAELGNWPAMLCMQCPISFFSIGYLKTYSQFEWKSMHISSCDSIQQPTITKDHIVQSSSAIYIHICTEASASFVYLAVLAYCISTARRQGARRVLDPWAIPEPMFHIAFTDPWQRFRYRNICWGHWQACTWIGSSNKYFCSSFR